MAHFAELNADNVVLRVVVVANEVIADDNGAEQENLGIGYLYGILGGRWKQTSYNTYRDYEIELDDSEPPQVIKREYLGSKHRLGGTPFRGQYAGVGDIYDADLDEFVTPAIEVAE